MPYSDKWLILRNAESEYFTARYEFMHNKNEMLTDLQQAMISASDVITALRLLLEMKPKFITIASLLSSILNVAIDFNDITAIGLAKDVLLNYKSESVLKENVLAVVANYLPGNDEWHYRRISEIYELLQYKEELADFISLCKLNDNWEIREISDDFLLRTT